MTDACSVKALCLPGERTLWDGAERWVASWQAVLVDLTVLEHSSDSCDALRIGQLLVAVIADCVVLLAYRCCSGTAARSLRTNDGLALRHGVDGRVSAGQGKKHC
jgi:hypothetical protein